MIYIDHHQKINTVMSTLTVLKYNIVQEWVHLKPHGLYALTYDDP